MKKLSIVVPVYFNEGSLEDLFLKLDAVRNELELLSVLMEVIFVDDGSKDNSLVILKKYKENKKNIKLIKLTRNFGAISAVKTGIEYITGDCFTFLAADLQDPPELIVEMVKRWLSGVEYTICERVQRKDPMTSRVFSKFYYILLRKFVVPSYPKKGFDLALMDSKYLKYIKKSGKHVNFPLYPFWLGVEPEKIYYNREERKHGKSKWTFSKKFKLLIDSIFSFSFAPVRLISGVGLIVSLLSFIYGLIVVFSALIGQVEVPGFATLASLISFLLGLIIVMLGVISEYVWRIFDEVNKHPYAVIEEEDI
ncbi:glycosyltransferase family 2 protein [Enterovibrio norvegicus]|uniref:glycosyltransferase family 2 protein n=1 Tax=Enterovibrio norvegicus TaxID=188144 RepID=UPI00352C5EA6